MESTKAVDAAAWMMGKVKESLAMKPFGRKADGGDDGKVQRGESLAESVVLRIPRPAIQGSIISRQIAAHARAGGQFKEFELPAGTELLIYRPPEKATRDRRIAAFISPTGQLVLFGDGTCSYRAF